MKYSKLLSLSLLIIGLISPTINVVHAEEQVQPQAGKTNVDELMNKAGTFYYKNVIAGTKDDCNDRITTCTYLPEPQKITHDIKSLKVTGQAGNVNLQEVMLEHIGEDILTNDTSDEPEIRYTSVYSVGQASSKTTTVNRSFILPNSVHNVLVGVDISGIGKEVFDFNLNTSESINNTKNETITTSPQGYKVKPGEVIQVVTELYALEYDGKVTFTAETDQKDINFAIQARGTNCKGVPGGTICVNKDKIFDEKFTTIYDNLSDSHKQELENGGLHVDIKAPGIKKHPSFKGSGEFEGIGGHRVETRSYRINDPKNPILLEVRSQYI